MTALQLDHVTKRFGDVVAVDQVSLTLDDHEIVALVGPSGCGKSTLLRVIAGLSSLDGGSVTLGTTVVDDGRTVVPPERRRIGLVFQEHALFPHLSVAGNVEFGIRDGDVGARSREMLDLVGLSQFADRYPHELSGGERQRVALARALAPGPALLLLDEPFASLDTNLRSRVRDDVISILRETRTPAVFVTHDQHDALAVGDRVAVLRSGRIAQIGKPVDVFHRPVDRFVGSFLGEADFLTFDEASTEFANLLTDPHDAAPTSDELLLLMTRPDDVEFSTLQEGTATIETAEFRGTHWCYTIRLRSGTTVRSLRSHLDRVPTGSRVAVRFAAGHQPVPVNI